MTLDRHLNWDGCFNARDLGGLPTADGRTTRWGAVVRSDSLDHLTTRGWAALEAHGVRTIVDLRNDEERLSGSEPRAAGITTVHVPLDDIADTALWEYIWANGLDGSPLYYRLFLERKPDRCAAAVAAVARAAPGGVVVHCGVGRDRTGLVTLLLLALAGVAADDIAADYELSTERLRAFYARRGEEDQGLEIEALLKRAGTTARALLLDILLSLNVDAYLRSAGLTEDDLGAVRTRLVLPAGSPVGGLDHGRQ